MRKISPHLRAKPERDGETNARGERGIELFPPSSISAKLPPLLPHPTQPVPRA